MITGMPELSGGGFCACGSVTGGSFGEGFARVKGSRKSDTVRGTVGVSEKLHQHLNGSLARFVPVVFHAGVIDPLSR